MLLERACLFGKVLGYVLRKLNVSPMIPALKKLTKRTIHTTTLEFRLHSQGLRSPNWWSPSLNTLNPYDNTPNPVVAYYLLEGFTAAEVNTTLSGQGSIMASQVLGRRTCPGAEPQSPTLVMSHGDSWREMSWDFRAPWLDPSDGTLTAKGMLWEYLM